MRVLYLNNRGSRWINVNENGQRDMPFLLSVNGSTPIRRKADYYSSWGNWGVIAYRYKGKRYESIPDEEIDRLPVVKLCE